MPLFLTLIITKEKIIHRNVFKKLYTEELYAGEISPTPHPAQPSPAHPNLTLPELITRGVVRGLKDPLLF
jgi:hypothetical protein